ncbi:MAG: hypothetical protein ACJ798_19480 [Phenylobacterium sp.]
MTATDRVRTFRLLAPAMAVSLAAVLAACSSPAPPPAPPPPMPVAEIPPISLSPKVVEQASAYRAYIAKASAISPGFTGGGDVAQSLKTGAAYEPQALLRGEIAYGAVAALQEPDYVAGVRKFAADPEQRRQVAYEVMKDPAYAVGFAGSAKAAGLVTAALSDDGRKLLDVGKSVKQAAYDVQHQAWSKGDVPGREGRLALTKELSSTPGLGEVSETARLQSAVTGAAQMGLSAPEAAPPYTPVVIHSLAVAALAALGYADDASLGQVMPILAEPTEATCLNMSKLNLYQCLAVAKPHYEDVFCLGQHVLMDTGKCLLRGAGAPDPIDAVAPGLTEKATPVSTSQTVRPRPKRR